MSVVYAPGTTGSTSWVPRPRSPSARPRSGPPSAARQHAPTWQGAANYTVPTTSQWVSIIRGTSGSQQPGKRLHRHGPVITDNRPLIEYFLHDRYVPAPMERPLMIRLALVVNGLLDSAHPRYRSRLGSEETDPHRAMTGACLPEPGQLRQQLVASHRRGCHDWGRSARSTGSLGRGLASWSVVLCRSSARRCSQMLAAYGDGQVFQPDERLLPRSRLPREALTESAAARTTARSVKTKPKCPERALALRSEPRPSWPPRWLSGHPRLRDW